MLKLTTLALLLASSANPCDDAILMYNRAQQSLSDGLLPSADSPTNASRVLTSRPSLQDLWDQFNAASVQMDEACKGQGPSR